jgi:hypothetical protein
MLWRNRQRRRPLPSPGAPQQDRAGAVQARDRRRSQPGWLGCQIAQTAFEPGNRLRQGRQSPVTGKHAAAPGRLAGRTRSRPPPWQLRISSQRQRYCHLARHRRPDSQLDANAAPEQRFLGQGGGSHRIGILPADGQVELETDRIDSLTDNSGRDDRRAHDAEAPPGEDRTPGASSDRRPAWKPASGVCRAGRAPAGPGAPDRASKSPACRHDPGYRRHACGTRYAPPKRRSRAGRPPSAESGHRSRAPANRA